MIALRRWRRALVVAAMVLSVGAFACWMFTELDPTWIALNVIMGVAALLAWIGFTIVAIVFLSQPQGRNPTVPRAIPWDEAEYLRWSAALVADQRSVLRQMLATPQLLTRRITEVISPSARTLDVDKIITVELPPTSSPHLILPVHEQKRGQLVDGLRIHLESGPRLSTLTQAETAMVLAVVLDETIDSLTARPGAATHEVAAARSTAKTLVRAIVSATDPAQSNPDMFALIDEHGPVRDTLGGDQKQVGILLRMIQRVAEFYPLLVLVPGVAASDPGPLREPVRIEVHRVEELERPVPSNVIVRLLYSILNLVPPRITYPLGQADLARSFHLQVVSPRRLYFYDLDVRPLYVVRGTPPPVPEFSGENRSGRELGSVGHYYVRDARNLGLFIAEVSFKEGRPGSIAIAAVWSGLLSMLGLSGLIVGNSSPAAATLLPVLFVGLSSGSIWQGVTQSRSIFGGRLATRLSSILNLILGFAAVVLSSLDARAAQPHSHIAADATAMWWILVLAASFTNTVTMLVYGLVDSQTEQWFSRAPRE